MEEYFSNPDEVLRAYESETLDIHANIKGRITNADKGTFLEDTTVGRGFGMENYSYRSWF
jgi:DNA-directed RNA polymerase subunit beta'